MKRRLLTHNLAQARALYAAKIRWRGERKSKRNYRELTREMKIVLAISSEWQRMNEMFSGIISCSCKFLSCLRGLKHETLHCAIAVTAPVAARSERAKVWDRLPDWCSTLYGASQHETSEKRWWVKAGISYSARRG